MRERERDRDRDREERQRQRQRQTARERELYAPQTTSVADTKVTSVADSKVNIGLVYEKTGRKSEAKTLFTEAAKICRNKLGPDHPRTRQSERLAAQ